MKKLLFCCLLSGNIALGMKISYDPINGNQEGLWLSFKIDLPESDVPLFDAVSNASYNTKERNQKIKAAVLAGSNPNQHYFNSLFYAVASRNLNLAVFIVQHGGDMSFVGQSGFSAKSYIESNFTPRKRNNFLKKLEYKKTEQEVS